MAEIKEKLKLVLDANAFIKQQNLSVLSNSYKFYLPYSVAYEIRDQKAKDYLDAFPFELDIVNPSKSSYDFVKEFSKATGDLGVLSEEDLDFIALTHELILENGKKDLIRKTPPKFVSNFVQKIDLSKKDDYKVEEEEKVKESESDSDDGFMEVIDTKASKKEFSKKSNPKNNGFGNPLQQNFEKKVEEKKKPEENEEGNDNDESDSDSSDGEWITPQNNDSNSKNDSNSLISNEVLSLGVAALSSDFAIQNVLLQIGVPLITLDGVKIRNVKKWVLFCYTCQTVVQDVEKKFCHSCGNATLNRLSCSVEADGRIRCFFKKNYKVNTRGNIYPIPKFKGGRKGNDLILRADEYLMGGKDIALRNEKKRKEKDFKAALSNLDNHFEIDVKKNKKGRNLDVGYGKINPNDKREFARKKGKFK